MVTTESGLQYKDIKVGQGPSPPVGFQVCNNFHLEVVLISISTKYGIVFFLPSMVMGFRLHRENKDIKVGQAPIRLFCSELNLPVIIHETKYVIILSMAPLYLLFTVGHIYGQFCNPSKNDIIIASAATGV